METLTTNSEYTSASALGRAVEIPALVVIWSRDAPERVGEVLLPDPATSPPRGWLFGRDDPGANTEGRLSLVRQRPGQNLDTEPLAAPRISREQLRIRPHDGDTLMLENRGRRTLLVDGVEVKRQRQVRAGAVVELRGQLMLLVAQRPVVLPALELPKALLPAFGQPDAFGIVGESPPSWALRGKIVFAASGEVPVLISGASGVGKELVAQAIHGLSARGRRPFISRNAATLPETLVDAELFGNIRDYPNPGMPERPGLIGAADRSSLFLDEIGELSHELQAHLLRVLDSGEYQSLGDARPRRADLRLIAATNRDVGELKHDLAARLRLRLEVPDLGARREDVALLIPHLLREIAARDPKMARRFVADGDASQALRVDPALIQTLVTHEFDTHVRELDGLLWTAMMHSVVSGFDMIRLAPGNRPPPQVDPASLTRAQIEDALDHADGVQGRAWRLLGLRSRYQLIRLLKKHDLLERQSV